MDKLLTQRLIAENPTRWLGRLHSMRNFLRLNNEQMRSIQEEFGGNQDYAEALRDVLENREIIVDFVECIEPIESSLLILEVDFYLSRTKTLSPRMMLRSIVL